MGLAHKYLKKLFLGQCWQCPRVLRAGNLKRLRIYGSFNFFRERKQIVYGINIECHWIPELKKNNVKSYVYTRDRKMFVDNKHFLEKTQNKYCEQMSQMYNNDKRQTSQNNWKHQTNFKKFAFFGLL